MLLTAIALFFIITNIIWLAMDTMPPSWDDSIHMKLSILYSRVVPQMASEGGFKEFMSLSSYYPPFFHISALPALYLYGFNEDYMVYVNFLYLIILIFSVHGIGKILFNSRVGVFSALLTLLYPIIFGLSRRYLLDFALVSMVCLVHYLALRYHKENKPVLGLLLFLSMISAGLVKQTAIIFFIPAIGLLFFRKCPKNKMLWVFPLSAFLVLFLIENRSFQNIMGRESFGYKYASVFNAIEIVKRVYGNLIWYAGEIRRTMASNFLLLFFF
ncbi:MAG: glycosyltransferase family 39 protein, partial [Candidatus Omnitrophota bacterium]